MTYIGDIFMQTQDLLQSLGLLYLGMIMHKKTLMRQTEKSHIDFQTLTKSIINVDGKKDHSTGNAFSINEESLSIHYGSQQLTKNQSTS